MRVKNMGRQQQKAVFANMGNKSVLAGSNTQQSNEELLKKDLKPQKSLKEKFLGITLKAQRTITQKRMADEEFKILFADSPKLEKEKMLLSSHYGMTFTHTRLFLPEKERERIVKKIRKKYPSVKLIKTYNAYRLEDGASTYKEHLERPTGEALWVKSPTLKDRKRVKTEGFGFAEVY